MWRRAIQSAPVDRRHVPVALCLAESLIRCGGKHDDADQIDTFVLWYEQAHHSSNGRRFDTGGATRAAIDGWRTARVVCGAGERRGSNGSHRNRSLCWRVTALTSLAGRPCVFLLPDFDPVFSPRRRASENRIDVGWLHCGRSSERPLPSENGVATAAVTPTATFSVLLRLRLQSASTATSMVR